MEIWKAIPGFEGYEVSDHGRVRSYRKPGHDMSLKAEPKILNPSMNGKYPGVGIRQNNKTKNVHVHSLVMLAFVGERPADQQVRHLDGNELNPRLDNLCYGTPSENTMDKFRHGTMPLGEKHPKSKLTESQVLQIIDLLKQGIPQSEIAKQFGVLAPTINHINKGRLWRHLNLGCNFSPVKQLGGKLSDEQVSEMKKQFGTGVSDYVIAAKFNVSRSQVQRIRTGIDHRTVE